MLKIEPASLKTLKQIKPIQTEKAITNNIRQMSPLITGAITLGATGIIVSEFVKNFNRTVEQNYFKLAKNPETKEQFQPEIFQKAAAMNLYSGNNVLVTAPTGTGKTAVAKYIITKNLKDGKRTFYTTPIKALSNDKYNEFCKIYGEKNVGILTGDTKINATAPIVVMTTEIYRNMAIAEAFNAKNDKNAGLPGDLATVVYDELHNLNDEDRGGIWEQSIIFTPQNVQMLSLSATINNNIDVNNWLASTKNNQNAVCVTPDKHYIAKNNGKTESVLINVPTWERPVPLNFSIIQAKAERTEKDEVVEEICAKPNDDSIKNLTRYLYENDLTPAIYFVFSIKNCRHLLNKLSNESEILTTKDEQKKIMNIVNKYKADDIYLGETLNIEALKKGYAIHNASLLPSQKKLVEELSQKGLLKVILATGTLNSGIDMPAKTVVMTSFRVPASQGDGAADNKQNMSVMTFLQSAGRAGRKGKSKEGYVYCLACNKTQKDIYEHLITSEPENIQSKLKLDYSFICQYSSLFEKDDKLKEIFSKTLFAFDSNSKKANSEKIDELLNTFNCKKNILLNDKFLDKNSDTTIKGEMLKILNGYEQIPIINMIADKTPSELNKSELAGLLASMANIEYLQNTKLPTKTFDYSLISDTKLRAEMEKLSKKINQYNGRMFNISDFQKIKLNYDSAIRVFTWAELNSTNSNSRKNWAKMYSKDNEIKMIDEGSFFKEIRMTCDLIKQLIKVSECGRQNSKSAEDKRYYADLNSKLHGILALIQKEPANEGI